MYSLISENHLSICDASRVSKTRLYGSCLMYRCCVLLIEIKDQNITLTGCLSFSARLSGCKCSPGYRQTNALLPNKIWSFSEFTNYVISKSCIYSTTSCNCHISVLSCPLWSLLLYVISGAWFLMGRDTIIFSSANRLRTALY